MRRQLGALALTLLFAAAARAESPSVAWIAVGGGGEPESTQLSLEEDVELARETFAGRGVTLFAGGPASFGVQVAKEPAATEDLLATLGDIFDPRPGRDASYRRPKVSDAKPASPDELRAAITEALSDGSEPLVLFFASHGEQGDSGRDNHIVLWGGFSFSALDLATVLDEVKSPRPVVLLNAACYGGGFSEFAFPAADAQRGAPKTVRCGLFATTDDEVASGCDPSPQRRDDEGYGRFVLRALRGEDQRGQSVPLSQVDLDQDGKVSLLEAHTRARIATRSFDIPTTTSERWLRRYAPKKGKVEKGSLPEEEAVVAALGRELRVDSREAAQQHQVALEKGFAAERSQVQSLEQRLDDAAADLRIALLERWPVLDDPWHPDFATLLKAQRKEIEEFLAASPLANTYRLARDDMYERAAMVDELQADVAVARRLTRAYETIELAGRLRAKGGPDWLGYKRLLACERTVPVVAPTAASVATSETGSASGLLSSPPSASRRRLR